MFPRVFAPWIRATNTNTLQMGATGGLYHVQTPAFVGGVSLSPMQRLGMAPVSPFVALPPRGVKLSPGEVAPASMAARPIQMPAAGGPLDASLGIQLV